MNRELKVSFYLKRTQKNERKEMNPTCPIVGKIVIGQRLKALVRRG